VLNHFRNEQPFEAARWLQAAAKWPSAAAAGAARDGGCSGEPEMPAAWGARPAAARPACEAAGAAGALDAEGVAPAFAHLQVRPHGDAERAGL